MCESRYCEDDGRWGGLCYLHDKVAQGLITGYYDGVGTFRPMKLHQLPARDAFPKWARSA
jgi:hypothetical protein